MTRRKIRRTIRYYQRYREFLRTYTGPVVPGWPEQVDRMIGAWITCLRKPTPPRHPSWRSRPRTHEKA